MEWKRNLRWKLWCSPEPRSEDLHLLDRHPHKLSEAHAVWVPLADSEVKTVVVNPVAEQPLAVTVAKGEQVVVRVVKSLILNKVGAHCIVTCSTRLENLHEDDDDDELFGALVGGFLLELLLDLLSLSVRSLFSDVELSKESSTASISLALISSVTPFKSSSIQDKLFTV